jgi:hypothetical protein
VPWCSYALECYHRRLGTASPAESAAMVWALGMMVPASVAAASAGGGEGQGVPSVSAAAASAAGAAAGGGKGGVNGTPGAAAGSGSGRGSSRKNTSVASAASAGAGAGSGGGKVLGQAAAAAAAAAAADAAAGGAQAGAEEEGGINGSGASGSWLRFYRPILLVGGRPRRIGLVQGGEGGKGSRGWHYLTSKPHQASNAMASGLGALKFSGCGPLPPPNHFSNPWFSVVCILLDSLQMSVPLRCLTPCTLPPTGPGCSHRCCHAQWPGCLRPGGCGGRVGRAGLVPWGGLDGAA